MFAGICFRESINTEFEASYGISKGYILIKYLDVISCIILIMFILTITNKKITKN